MKPGALLINVARGKLIDDEARRRGAARRPARWRRARRVQRRSRSTPSSPYWDLPNVIVTPHTSGAMQDYWTPLVALFSENLRRFENGAAAERR